MCSFITIRTIIWTHGAFMITNWKYLGDQERKWLILEDAWDSGAGEFAMTRKQNLFFQITAVLRRQRWRDKHRQVSDHMPDKSMHFYPFTCQYLRFFKFSSSYMYIPLAMPTVVRLYWCMCYSSSQIIQVDYETDSHTGRDRKRGNKKRQERIIFRDKHIKGRTKDRKKEKVRRVLYLPMHCIEGYKILTIDS